MSIINQLKKTFRPLKNRLYALPLYLQRYANNEVILNGARLKKVKIKIRGSENRVYIHSSQVLENSEISLNCGSSSNLVVISFLFHRSSSFLILLKVVDMFAF